MDYMAFNLYLEEWKEQELDCYPPRRDFTALALP